MVSSEQKLAELWARAEIRDCTLRYARGVDRHDWDLVRSAFHPDAVERHGTFYGGVDEFVAWLRSRFEGDEARSGAQNLICNELVEFDGDLAHVETYFRAGYGISGSKVALSAGRYVARFENRSGAWRIAAREVVIDWRAVTDSFEGVGGASGGYGPGGVDRTDPSYMRPFVPEPPN